MDPMSVGSTSSTQEEPQEKRVVQSQEQQEQPQQQIQQNSKPNPNLDPHVKPKPKTIHADATVEHLEEAPHPPEEAAKILVRDALVSAAVTAEVARGTDDNTPPSEETMNGGSRSTITVTTTLATSTDEAGSPSETPEASTVEAGDRGDGPSKVVRTSSRVPDSGSVVQAVQDEGNEAEQVGAFCVAAAPISLSEAARQLLPASSSGNGDPKLDIAQDLEPSTVPTEILGKGKASSSPSAIAAPFPIHKAAPRSVVPYFGESDVEVEREIRSWLTPSLNSSTPTLATSDTWHKPPQTPTAPVIRQKPLQRKMSYSASGSGSGSTALNIPSTTLASTNSPARVNGLSGAVRPNAPETRDAPPRSAFALTAAALTNASMPGGTNGPPGTTPHHTHDDESDPEMHEPDRWGAVQLHEHHHERELDRRSRELDRRERELERRERELERRMREFDSERARWSTEVKSAPAWSEALSTLAAQMDARFNEERKKAEEREVKWARALQRGLLARVQEAIERERRLYGVPERMSEQEVNELMESSVGWLMQSDEDIADRVRFQSLLHLAQERLAMEAGLQPAPGSSSLALAWRLALGPSVITEIRYNKALELLEARSNHTGPDDTSKAGDTHTDDLSKEVVSPSNTNPLPPDLNADSPLDPLTRKVMANKAAMEYVVEFTSHLRKEGSEMLGEQAFAPGRILRDDYMESVRRQAARGAVDGEALEVLVEYICPG